MTKTELNKLKKSELIDLLLERPEWGTTGLSANPEYQKHNPDEPIQWSIGLSPTGKLSRFDVYRLKTQGDRVLEKEILETNTLKKRALNLLQDESFFTFLHKGGYYVTRK